VSGKNAQKRITRRPFFETLFETDPKNSGGNGNAGSCPGPAKLGFTPRPPHQTHSLSGGRSGGRHLEECGAEAYKIYMTTISDLEDEASPRGGDPQPQPETEKLL